MPSDTPLSVEDVLCFRRQRYRTSAALVRAKGHDYNREQQNGGDTLFNLRIAALMGIVDTPERGILVRLMDKMMRLASLTTGDAQAAVKQESVFDTVDDVHNYVDYLALLWSRRTAGFGALTPEQKEVWHPDHHVSDCEETDMLRNSYQGRYNDYDGTMPTGTAPIVHLPDPSEEKEPEPTYTELLRRGPLPEAPETKAASPHLGGSRVVRRLHNYRHQGGQVVSAFVESLRPNEFITLGDYNRDLLIRSIYSEAPPTPEPQSKQGVAGPLRGASLAPHPEYGTPPAPPADHGNFWGVPPQGGR